MIARYLKYPAVLLVWVGSFTPQLAIAQGEYREVTPEDVLAMKLFHYFTPDESVHEPDFKWCFKKKTFVLTADTGGLPADLQERLLPEGATAREIRGRWRLDDKNGRRLILTDITAKENEDEETEFAGRKRVRLPIYRTAPSVIRVGHLQYVFSIE